ncbi:(2Fe-2S)-binding protein [Novosphingobium flavum]|uniref:(2Fe-2S)-binding protein n=1 Tax=Novosphingobium flavum TaxID=1778672 RepID=A0A7X1FSV7_9SPHN|nr:(2Fe-2S)-binding protein [Novosphingobium flavum]MBC2665852.1 (2Fe-2S)-binding protein [Novosphingobium flavum]
MKFDLTVNGRKRTVEAPAEMPLLWVLRDELGLVGTKFGCGIGMCGACTVHLGGKAVRSCQTPVSEVGKGAVVTIEQVGASAVGAKLQKAWTELDVPQCGYCQAGQLMSASALLAQKPKPAREEIAEAMNGNICRCGTYDRIFRAIELAAGTGGKANG